MNFATSTTLVIALLVTACGAEQKATTDTAAAEAQLVKLSLANGNFEAPDTIAAGLTTFQFTNLGDDIHYAHAVRLDSSRTEAQFLEEYAMAVRNRGPRPTYITRSGGPGGTAPGDTWSVTHMIEPGRYVWICPVDDREGIPHFAHGERRSFIVRAADAGARVTSPPNASQVIRLVNFGFTFDAPLRSGQHTIRIVNEGPDPHDLAILKLEPGKTANDLQAWLQKPDGPPPFSGVGGVAVLAAGMEAYIDMHLTPGNYVLTCMATAQDGRTHIEHGMIQQIRIS